MKLLLFFTLFTSLTLACPPVEKKIIETNIIEDSIPISPTYTQGLIYSDGMIYESSGIYGESKLLVIDPGRGTKKILNTLPDKIFAEGLTKLGENFYQFSWKEKIVFIYKNNNWNNPTELSFDGEAWGVTTHRNKLLLSNGSAQLLYLNPMSLEIEETIQVKQHTTPLESLNELEIVDGKIWANTWGSDKIYTIRADTGCVETQLDLSQLHKLATRHAQTAPDYDPWEHVLNGIAYDRQKREVYVTGKNWSKIFKLKLESVFSSKHDEFFMY